MDISILLDPLEPSHYHFAKNEVYEFHIFGQGFQKIWAQLFKANDVVS